MKGNQRDLSPVWGSWAGDVGAGRWQRPEGSLCPLDQALQNSPIPLAMARLSWWEEHWVQCGTAMMGTENMKGISINKPVSCSVRECWGRGHPIWCQDCSSGNYSHLLPTRNTQVTGIATQLGWFLFVLLLHFDKESQPSHSSQSSWVSLCEMHK